MKKSPNKINTEKYRLKLLLFKRNTIFYLKDLRIVFSLLLLKIQVKVIIRDKEIKKSCNLSMT